MPRLLVCEPTGADYDSPFVMDEILAVADLSTAKLEDLMYYTPKDFMDRMKFYKCPNQGKPVRSFIQMWRLAQELELLQQMDSRFILRIIKESVGNPHSDIFLATLIYSKKLKMNYDAMLSVKDLQRLSREMICLLQEKESDKMWEEPHRVNNEKRLNEMKRKHEEKR